MSTGVTYVLGNPATGKSTLMRLLDGHPDLAVSPIQDTLIGAFTSYNPIQWFASIEPFKSIFNYDQLLASFSL